MTLVSLFRKIFSILLYASICGEICFFFSWANLCGCLMTWIVWRVFSNFFFKAEIIGKYPFAFMMYLSMFFYRFLPLPVTLLEGKPITYGLQLPYHTFILEIFLFLVSSLAFYFSFSKRKTNNWLQHLLRKVGFFQRYPEGVIWWLAFVGLFSRIVTYSVGEIEYGDVSNKFLIGLTYLMYSPAILLIPDLFYANHIVNRSSIFIWGYLIVIFLIGISSNSREGMIAPIALLSLLYFLWFCKSGKMWKFYVSPLKITVIGVIGYLLIGVLGDFSIAMLYNRNIRSEVSKTELFQRTWDTFQNEALMSSLKNAGEQLANQKKLKTYDHGWDETYVDNFMLNRYCNIRITDQTLYYALKLDEQGKKIMQKDFLDRIWLILPTPILRLLGSDLNKNNYEFSRGDLLYATATKTSVFAGYRVTSHLGDGIATFGYFYYVIQFVLWLLVFKLLNTFVYYTKLGIVYSLYGLIGLFTFIGMFRNANGCSSDIGYLIRGYWQGVVTFLIVSFIVKSIYSLIRNKR